MKNNTPANFKKRNNIFRSFLFLFRDTFLYNYIVKFQRFFNSKLGGRKIKLPNLRGISFRNLPRIRFTGLIIIFVVIAVLFSNIALYFRLSPKPYIDETKSASPYNRTVYDNTINVLFLGFENRLNDYRYASFLVLASIDPQSNVIKLYGIDPNFIVSTDEGDFPIRTLWNNLTTENSTRFDQFISIVQNFLAVRIDRYFSFDLSDFKNYISSSGLKIAANDNFTQNSLIVKKGEQLGGELLYDYLFDKNQPDDVVTNRQVSFTHDFLTSLKGIFGVYNNLINFQDFNKVFKTDLSRNEYISFLINVNSFEIFYSDKYFLSSTFGTRDKDPLNKDVSPDFNLIDDNLGEYLNNIDIMKEQAAIEIYNGTDTPGLAGNMKRFFENLGGNVIKFGNYPKIDNTILYVPSKNVEKYKNNIIMIRRTLRGNVKISFDDFTNNNYSGDLLLALGKDSLNI